MCYSKLWDLKYTKFSYNDATGINTTFIWIYNDSLYMFGI
jgi:hypothetical protein